jgi:hypothetical protein
VNPRTTLWLFLATAALGAFVWFYQVEGASQRQEAEEQQKRLFPELASEDVQAIAFTTTDDREVRLAFGDGGWRLVEPLDFAADESALTGIASALAQLASEGRIPGEDAQAPEVYGLAEGAREVRFGGSELEHVLYVGKNTPVGSNTYVSVDERPDVYTVATHRVSSFEKTLDELRETRVLRFDRAAVQSLEASWPGGSVALEKRDDAWHLTAPLEAPADERTLDDLLADLSFLRAESFLDEPDPAVAAGFAEPAFEVRLGGAPPEEGGEAPVWELAIGGPLEGAQRAVRGAGSVYYTVPAERLDDLPRRLALYRYRTLADFVASDARRLELIFHPEEGEPVRIEATRGDAGWASEPEPIDSAKAARIVAELARLRASDILAESMGPEELAGVGLTPPRVVLRAFGEGADDAPLLGEVALGNLDADGIVAQSPGSDVVYRLGFELAEHLPVSLEAFRNRFLSQAEPAAAVPDAAETPDAAVE